MAMYKKLYDSPTVTIEPFEYDVIVMSGGGAVDSDGWDNSTSWGITL